LTPNILENDRDIKNRKQILLTSIPAEFSEKIGELWSTNKKVTGTDVDLP